MKLNETEEYKAVRATRKDLLTQMTINKVLSEVTVTDEDAKNTIKKIRLNLINQQQYQLNIY